MDKKGFMYSFKHVFWAFVIGFIIGAVLIYLSLEELIPFKIPFL